MSRGSASQMSIESARQAASLSEAELVDQLPQLVDLLCALETNPTVTRTSQRVADRAVAARSSRSPAQMPS